jgi:hypothetical protein
VIKENKRLKNVTRVFTFMSLFLTAIEIFNPKWYFAISLLFIASTVGFLQAYMTYVEPQSQEKNKNGNKRTKPNKTMDRTRTKTNTTEHTNNF